MKRVVIPSSAKRRGIACPYLEEFVREMVEQAREGETTPCRDVMEAYQHFLRRRTADPTVLALATDRLFAVHFRMVARSKGWEFLNRNPKVYRLHLLRPQRMEAPKAATAADVLKFLEDPPEVPHVEVQRIPGLENRDKGFGLIARQHIPQGTVLAEYVGQIIEGEEHGWREDEYQQKSMCPRTVHLEHGKFLDGWRHPDGRFFENIHQNVGCMANHSNLSPNARLLSTTTAAGTRRFALVSICALCEGQEVTWNYAPTDRNKQESWMRNS